MMEDAVGLVSINISEEELFSCRSDDDAKALSFQRLKEAGANPNTGSIQVLSDPMKRSWRVTWTPPEDHGA
jgi:hypothetical protein